MKGIELESGNLPRPVFTNEIYVIVVSGTVTGNRNDLVSDGIVGLLGLGESVRLESASAVIRIQAAVGNTAEHRCHASHILAEHLLRFEVLSGNEQ